MTLDTAAIRARAESAERDRDRLAAQYTSACRTIDQIAAERDQAITALSKAAEARGRAEGKLAASDLPGIIDGWKDRAEKAEAEVERMRAMMDENSRLNDAMLVLGAYLMEKGEAFRTGEGSELLDAYSAALQHKEGA